MFKQLFASMNDALDDIISQITTASGAKRAELEERLSVLKAMSDTCIEEWLLFEEKLGQLTGKEPGGSTHDHPAAYHQAYSSDYNSDYNQEDLHASIATKPAQSKAAEPAKAPETGSFDKGQGYYKLAMFRDAVTEFEQVVRQQPDYLLARIYLAMSYLRTGEFGEAYRQFQFLVPLTDDRKMKAISYNAMGCIQAENHNLDKAMEYFRLAHSADPGSIEPVLNLKHWSKRN